MKKELLIGLLGLVMQISYISPVQAEEISVFIHNATSVYVLDESMKVQAIYSQTATNKGHLTAGHSLTLKVFDLPKGTLTAVELSVKSNKTEGSGEMTMLMDKQELWSIANSAFSSDNWYGEYSNEFVTIAKEVSVELKDTLVMTMQATANSLYWQSLKLTYTPAPAEPHTLTLVSQTEPTQVLEEAEGGSGVVLPKLPDVEEWHFAGWSPEQIVEAEMGTCFYAGSTYYPQDNETLYAAYVWTPFQTIEATTELTSGTYAIMAEHATGLLMAVDLPADGVWPVVTQAGSFGDEAEVPGLTLMYLTEECRYEVERDGDSIMIRAAETQDYIGYSNAGVLQVRGENRTNRKWAVTPTADGSWAVHKTLNNHCYLIYAMYVNVETSDEVGLKSFYFNELLPELRNLFFFPIDASLPTEQPETRYTTYPLGYTAVETVVLDEAVEAVYLPDGRRVGSRLENLPGGFYILRQGTKTRKVWLQ